MEAGSGLGHLKRIERNPNQSKPLALRNVDSSPSKQPHLKVHNRNLRSKLQSGSFDRHVFRRDLLDFGAAHPEE